MSNSHRLPIAILGANGVVGRYLCMDLKISNIPFVALVRYSTDISWLRANSFSYRMVDIYNKSDFVHALYGCSGLISLPPITSRLVKAILSAMSDSSLSRLVLTSTSAIDTSVNPEKKT